MKRFLTALVLLLTLSLVGCDLGGNALESAFEELENAESVTMVTTLSNVPVFETMQFTVKEDDTLYSMEMLEQVTYYEIIDDELYGYYISDGAWVTYENPERDLVDYDMTQEFTPEDFEEVDGVWVLQLEQIYLDDEETEYISNVEITLDDDGFISLIEYDITNDENYTMGVSMVFSDYGTTVVELPAIE